MHKNIQFSNLKNAMRPSFGAIFEMFLRIKLLELQS